MKYFTSLSYFIFAFPIDISNIFTNVFIIFALRKLKKLNNISFWFLYWLSISDLFVGLSGFTLDISYVSCLTRLNCSWIRFIYAVRSFFTGHSARLTIIIAIDRSIRMTSHFKYNTIMTKKKANMALIFNGVLGIVKFFGSLGQHRNTFEMVYGIFHVICIFSGCILYIIIYYITKQKVSDLHSNMQRWQKEAIVHTNVPAPPSQPKAHELAEGILVQGSSRDERNSQTTLLSPGSQGSNSERDQQAVPGKVSLGNSSPSNEILEKSIEIKPSSKDVANKNVPGRKNGITDHNQGDQYAISQSRDAYSKAEKNTKNPKDTNHRKRNDNDVGRAMLFITMAILLCYVPIVAEDSLRTQNTDSTVLEHLATLLLLANSSCNAIILTVFSKDVRNLAKRLL